jgi:hypothetical protein
MVSARQGTHHLHVSLIRREVQSGPSVVHAAVLLVRLFVHPCPIAQQEGSQRHATLVRGVHERRLFFEDASDIEVGAALCQEVYDVLMPIGDRLVKCFAAHHVHLTAGI